MRGLLSERSQPMLDIAWAHRNGEGPLSFPGPGKSIELKRLDRSGRLLLALVSDGEKEFLLPMIEEKGLWKIDLVNMALLGSKGTDFDTMPRIIR